MLFEEVSMIGLVISTILFSLTFQSPAQNKSVGLGPPPTNPNHFTISLLRSDGVLIPFAEYAQKQWVNPWPKSADSSKDEPNTVADLSKPWFVRDGMNSSTWYFSSPGDGIHVLKASRIVKVQNHCQIEWGLMTDLDREVTRSNQYGTVGIAADGELEIDPVVQIDPKTGEWVNLTSFIEPVFSREEEITSAELSSFLGACRKNQESQKTGNQKPFDAIEKLVRGQMWAKIFSAKSFCLLFRQAPSAAD
jgi:hypothetical protein